MITLLGNRKDTQKIKTSMNSHSIIPQNSFEDSITLLEER